MKPIIEVKDLIDRSFWQQLEDAFPNLDVTDDTIISYADEMLQMALAFSGSNYIEHEHIKSDAYLITQQGETLQLNFTEDYCTLILPLKLQVNSRILFKTSAQQQPVEISEQDTVAMLLAKIAINQAAQMIVQDILKSEGEF